LHLSRCLKLQVAHSLPLKASQKRERLHRVPPCSGLGLHKIATGLSKPLLDVGYDGGHRSPGSKHLTRTLLFEQLNVVFRHDATSRHEDIFRIAVLE